MTTNRPIIQSSLLFRRRLTANNIFIHNRFPKYHFNNLSNSINENNPPKSKHLFRYIAGSVAVSGIASSVYYFFYKEKLPINNNSDNQQHKIVLSPSEATLKLREKQTSFLLHRNNGVYRYDTNQLASNCPIEDTKTEEIDLGAKNGDRLFFGVFDGHSGWNTSRLLSKKLVPVIKEQLNKAYDGYGEYAKVFPNKKELVKNAIRNGFVEIDDEIVIHSINRLLNTPNKSDGISYIDENLLSALSGSCALLAYIETATNDLYVACAGDSRAVIGVKDQKTGKWKALPLSEDQTGRNENEVKRLEKEHPGESNIIMNGRIFGGLEPSRAFGDAKYKWDRSLQETIYSKFFKEKRRVPGNDKFKTPPYVTARPEVVHHEVGPDDKFLVLATDGLWERLSNAEVVELVGLLIEGKRNGKDVSDGLKELDTNESKKKFAFVDENASTHLIRNALGGAAEDVLCAMLSLPSPMSRRWRDDITVTVVFFGKD